MCAKSIHYTKHEIRVLQVSVVFLALESINPMTGQNKVTFSQIKFVLYFKKLYYLLYIEFDYIISTIKMTLELLLHNMHLQVNMLAAVS